MRVLIRKKKNNDVYRWGVSRDLARKIKIRRKRSSPNVFEMAATETITSIILIKLIRVSVGIVSHPRRFKIVVIDIQTSVKQRVRDVIGIMVNGVMLTSRRRHTRSLCGWSSDVCSSD